MKTQKILNRVVSFLMAFLLMLTSVDMSVFAMEILPNTTDITQSAENTNTGSEDNNISENGANSASGIITTPLETDSSETNNIVSGNETSNPAISGNETENSSTGAATEPANSSQLENNSQSENNSDPANNPESENNNESANNTQPEKNIDPENGLTAADINQALTFNALAEEGSENEAADDTTAEDRILEALCHYLDNDFTIYVELINEAKSWNLYYSETNDFENESNYKLISNYINNSSASKYFSGIGKNCVKATISNKLIDPYTLNYYKGYFYAVPCDSDGNEIPNIKSKVVNNVNSPLGKLKYVVNNDHYEQKEFKDVVIIEYNPEDYSKYEIVDVKKGIEIHVGEAKRLGVAFLCVDDSIIPASSHTWVTSLYNDNDYFWYTEDVTDAGFKNKIWGKSNPAAKNIAIATDSPDASLNLDVWITGKSLAAADTKPDYLTMNMSWFKWLSQNNSGEYYNMTNNVNNESINYSCSAMRIPVTVLEAEKGVEYTQVPVIKYFDTAEEGLEHARTLAYANNTSESFFVPYDDLNNNKMTRENLLDFEAERDGILPWQGDYMQYTFLDAHLINPGTVQYDGKTYGEWKVITQDHHTVTVEMEEEFSNKINSLVHDPNGKLYEGKYTTDEQKIKAVFDYITKNVSGYVGENNSPEEREQAINHTAYTALMKGYGTCQAFAVLFTRLSRELGIPSKVIMGTDANAHTYNIVKKGVCWYYIDCSAGIYLRDYNSFKRTEEQAQYRSDKFVKNYISKIEGYGGKAQNNIEILKNGEFFNYASTIEEAKEIVSEQINYDIIDEFPDSEDESNTGSTESGEGVEPNEGSTETGVGELTEPEVNTVKEYNEYTIRLLTDATLKSSEALNYNLIDINSSEVKYFADRVCLDMNNKKISISAVEANVEIRMREVKNGTLAFTGRDSSLILRGYDSAYYDESIKYDRYIPEDGCYHYNNVKFIGNGNVERLKVEQCVTLDSNCTMSSINYVYAMGSARFNCNINTDSFIVNKYEAGNPAVVGTTEINGTLTAKNLEVSSDAVINSGSISNSLNLCFQNENTYGPYLIVKDTIKADNINIGSYSTLVANVINGTSASSKLNMDYRGKLLIGNKANLYNFTLSNWGMYAQSYGGIYKKEEASVYISNTANKISNPGYDKFYVGIYQESNTETQTEEDDLIFNFTCPQYDGGVTDENGNYINRKYVVSDILKREKLFGTGAGKTFDVLPFALRIPIDSSSRYKIVSKEGNAVYANANNIILKVVSSGEEEIIGEYPTWSDAADLIEKISDPLVHYVVEICDDTEIITSITQPARAASLTLKGKRYDGTNTPVEFKFIGDWELNNNTVVENLILSSNKLDSYSNRIPYNCNLNLNANSLTLKNSEFLTINGVSSAGTATQNNLVLDDSVIKTSGNVNVTGTTTLDDGVIDADGTVTLNNVVSDSNIDGPTEIRNRLFYGKNNAGHLLTINGNITAKNTVKDLYACRNTDSDPYLLTADKNQATNTYAKYGTIKDNAIGIAQKRRAVITKTEGTEDPKHINYKERYNDNVILVNSAKATASNFVVLDIVENNGIEVINVKSLTKKSPDGKTIMYGGFDSSNTLATLLSSPTGEDGSYTYEGSFTTFNDAFAQIDRIGISTNYYRVAINNSYDISTVKLDKLNFPSKLKELRIEAEGQGSYIPYKGGISIKSNVIFDNIRLAPYESAGISIGNYRLVFDHCRFDMASKNGEYPFTSVSGSNVNGNSEFVILNSDSQSGQAIEFTINGALNNVSKVKLENTVLYVNGAVNIGDIAHDETDTNTEMYGLATISRGTASYNGVRTSNMVTKIASSISIQGKVHPNNAVGIGFREKVTGTDKVVRYKSVPLFNISDVDAPVQKYENSNVTADMRYYYSNIRTVQIAKTPNLSFDKDANKFTLASQNKKVLPESNMASSPLTADSYFTKIGQFLTLVETSVDKAQVYLEYNEVEGDDNTKVSIPFMTWNDAISEINNLKINRDYVIKVTKAQCNTDSQIVGVNSEYLGTKYSPKSLSMPSGRYAKSLTIKPYNDAYTADIYYTGDISFGVPTKIEDTKFYRCEKSKANVNTFVKDCYYAVDELTDGYPNVVPALKLNDQSVTIENKVLFNTPLKISGSAKSSLIISEGATFTTEVKYYDMKLGDSDGTGTVWEIASTSDGNVILGSITGIGRLEVPSSGLKVYNAITYGANPEDNKNSGVPSVTANVNVNRIVARGQLYVHSYSYKKNKEPLKDANGKTYYSYHVALNGKPNATVKVETLETYNGADVVSDGTLNIANVEMHGTGSSTDASVKLKSLFDFNITGTISAVDGQTKLNLVTHKNGKEDLDAVKPVAAVPHLNISGKIDNSVERQIEVSVLYSYLDPDQTNHDYTKFAALGDASDTRMKNSAKLLTARNCKPENFVASLSNIGNNPPYSEATTNGYIIVKSGNDMFVYYSENINVGVYEVPAAADMGGGLYLADGTVSGNDQEEFVGYYISLNEAVKAIDARNNKKADYCIKLYNDLGTNEALTGDINLPTKARSVVLTNLNNEKINYKGKFNAKIPVKLSKIVVKGYENASFNAADVYISNGSKIEVDKGTVNTNNVSHDGDAANEISYGVNSTGKANLYIKGDINNVINTNKLSLSVRLLNNKTIENNYKLPKSECGKKIDLPDGKKLANLDKAPTCSVSVSAIESTTDSVGNSSSRTITVTIVKANKALFAYDLSQSELPTQGSGNSYETDQTVKINRFREDSYNDSVWSDYGYYLDWNQAIAEINYISDATSYYLINLGGKTIKDTVVTDGAYVGGFTFPSDNEAAGIKIYSSQDTARIYFKPGTINMYGKCILENIEIVCPKVTNIEPTDTIVANECSLFTINLKQNSNKKLSYRQSELTFKDSSSLGVIGTVSGVKLVSKLVLDSTQKLFYVNSLNSLSLELKDKQECSLGAACNIDNLIVPYDSAPYNNNSPVIYSQVDNKNNPGLKVNEQVIGGVALINIGPYGSHMVGYSKEDSSGRPIVNAPKASSDKFMTNQLKGDAEVISYKDARNYVMCADSKDMQVKLLYEKDGIPSETYAKCYLDAIKIINNLNDKMTDYTIEVLDNENTKILKTGDKGANYAGLSLPGANKSRSLKIIGVLDSNGNPITTLNYTGGMNLSTNLILKNINISEGYLKDVVENGKKVKKFFSYDYVTANMGAYSLEFEDNVKSSKTGHVATYEEDIVFQSVAGKGIVDVKDKSVRINKALNINELKLNGSIKIAAVGETNISKLTLGDNSQSEVALTSDNKITIGDIEGNGDDKVKVSYTMISPLKKSSTQPNLNITGSIDNADLILEPRYIENNVSHNIVNNENNVLDALFVPENDKPINGQMVAVVPKAQTEKIEIEGIGKLDGGNSYGIYSIKCGTGLYLTKAVPNIIVEGYSDIDLTKLTYKARCSSWINAVNDINRVGSKVDGNNNSYVKVIVSGAVDAKVENINDMYSHVIDVQVKNIAMPSNVKKLTIVGQKDSKGIEGALYFTGDKVVLNSDTEIINMDVQAYKVQNIKYSNWGYVYYVKEFYKKPFDMNIGNYELIMRGCDNVFGNDLSSSMNVSGTYNGRSKFEYYPMPERNQYDDFYYKVYSLGKIQNVYNVILHGSEIIQHRTDVGSNLGPDYDFVDYHCRDINKVNYLTVKGEIPDSYDNVSTVLNALEKTITVDNLSIDRATVKGANVTVDKTLSLNCGNIYAGTDRVGEGKLKLQNVNLTCNGNVLSCRQNKSGESQLEINGEVINNAETVLGGIPMIEVLLYYSEKTEKTTESKNIAKLYDGMLLLKDKKKKINPNELWQDEANINVSLIRPKYDMTYSTTDNPSVTITEKYMGKENSQYEVVANNGKIVYRRKQ